MYVVVLLSKTCHCMLILQDFPVGKAKSTDKLNLTLKLFLHLSSAIRYPPSAFYLLSATPHLLPHRSALSTTTLPFSLAEHRPGLRRTRRILSLSPTFPSLHHLPFTGTTKSSKLVAQARSATRTTRSSSLTIAVNIRSNYCNAVLAVGISSARSRPRPYISPEQILSCPK